MKIDLHCHAFPGEVLHAMHMYYPDVIGLKQRAGGAVHVIHSDTPLPVWDPGIRINEIADAGVDLELLSCPLVYLAMDGHQPELCRLANDTLADACLRHPDRFEAFAHVPFNDLDAGLDELSRCLDQLGFAGVLISSSIGEHHPDDPECEPFWREVNRRRVPVFLHPSLASGYRDDPLPPFSPLRSTRHTPPPGWSAGGSTIAIPMWC